MIDCEHGSFHHPNGCVECTAKQDISAQLDAAIADRDAAHAFINDMVSEKLLHGSNPSLIAKAAKLGCLPDHVKQLIEGHVEGPTRLGLAEGRVQELETERRNIVDALGCHPAHVLDEIGRITEKLTELPNIDRMRQAESRVRELEAAVRDAENTLIMSERRKIEARAADAERRELALREFIQFDVSVISLSSELNTPDAPGNDAVPALDEVIRKARSILAATPADLAAKYVKPEPMDPENGCDCGWETYFRERDEARAERDAARDERDAAVEAKDNAFFNYQRLLANNRDRRVADAEEQRDAAIAEVERLKADLSFIESGRNIDQAELARVTAERDARLTEEESKEVSRGTVAHYSEGLARFGEEEHFHRAFEHSLDAVLTARKGGA